MSFLSSIGSSISNFFSGGSDSSNMFSSAGNLANALIQRNWQKDDSKKAFERSLYAWDLNNEYNSPAQQMQRLREAGLNPNLIYGSGSVTGNASGQSPTAPMARNSGLTLFDYQDLLAKDATIKNIEAEADMRKQMAGYYSKLKDKVDTEDSLLGYEDRFYSYLEELFGVGGKGATNTAGSVVKGTGQGADAVAKGFLPAFGKAIKNILTFKIKRR